MKASPEQAERLHTFAHDLRNRLIGLQQVLDHLKQESAEQERAELVLYGEQQFFKALREVERVMDDLGVERGTVEPVLADVPLAAFLRERISLMQHRFLRKEQTVRTVLDEHIVVRADGRILADLVDALLSNASKFSASGTTVDVVLDRAAAQAQVRVKDRGTGLTAEDLQLLFVRFAWLSNRPTAGEAQGRSTLARAREWARAHGGDITASSAGKDQGSTLSFTLPLRS
ncbi:MAG: HAMP domain-containing histidine kinase [Flavobacteriales bacterium]|nr:HAMP domain-containing histidine kinase [Flavobacteriales bacterium]